jgi:hypothetical protein
VRLPVKIEFNSQKPTACRAQRSHVGFRSAITILKIGGHDAPRVMNPNLSRGVVMFSSVRQLITAGLFVACMSSSQAMAQSITSAEPDVPSDLVVGEDFVFFAKGAAIGTQNYMCLPATGGGVAWKNFAPEATLYVTVLGFHPQFATHFLSANPDEGGLVARPTWQQSIDSSKVWGKLLKMSTDANFVEPGAIPWLLLEVVGREAGPDGGSFLTQAARIQRINTSGGVAPVTGCSQPSDVGALALVPYTADYFFYKPRRPR